jgi:hypothetical protein
MAEDQKSTTGAAASTRKTASTRRRSTRRTTPRDNPLKDALNEPTSADVAKKLDSEPVDKQPKESSLKEADRVSGPFIDDATISDPPLRTALPNEPMIQSLAVGAGKHEPLDDKRFGPDGRPRQDVIQEAAKEENPA